MKDAWEGVVNTAKIDQERILSGHPARTLSALAGLCVAFSLGLAWPMLELEKSRVEAGFTTSAREQWFISQLRELGCLAALDDFGSGMSSFVYLKHLPVDFLKIGGSFVRNIQHSRMDRAMVHAIQQIANELGIRTIAEYVESATTRDEIRALGVDFLQGYFIGEPAPIEACGSARPQPLHASR